MNIIVLLKQVPDTWGERSLALSTGRLDRFSGDQVLDEIGERALEVALVHKDARKDAEVIAVSMGPAGATDVLRKALSMGATSAIHILDDSLAGSDILRTATALAAAISSTSYDLIIAGNESTDGRGGVIPAMLAEMLGCTQLTSLDTVSISATEVSGSRSTDYGTIEATATLPAVISVTERSPEARFPSFKGILTAKKKPLSVLTVADLALDAEGVGRSLVTSTSERPPREAGVKVVDDGRAAAGLVEYLAANRLV